jgi:CRP-like cAMP-binding protein
VNDRSANDASQLGRAYAVGEVVFREGEPGQQMYVIQSGRVQLARRVRGRDIHLATLPPGEFFGEMAIVNGRPRSATATVVEAARLLVLDGRTFEAMVRGNAEIALRLIKKLAARLAQANSQVEMLLLADLNQRVVHHLRHLAATRGMPDSNGVRIDISVDELAENMDADRRDVTLCLDRLEQARLLRRALGSVEIAEVGKLDQFLEFLDMKDRYGENG